MEELKRTSLDASNDPLLSLAKQLPRVPKVNETELASLAATLHQLVFQGRGSKAAGSPQALSDCRHLAHATLARAAGFITSDGELLSARDDLLALHGIDVAGLDELVSLLPSDAAPPTLAAAGQGFSCSQLSSVETREHLQSLGASAEIVDEFSRDIGLGYRVERYGIVANNDIVALGALSMPRRINTPAHILVQVRQTHQRAELFVEHLFAMLLERVTVDGPVGVVLCRLPGQTLISRIAETKGFFEINKVSSKIALGQPLTPTNWDQVSTQMRRRIGVELPRPIGNSTKAVMKDSDGKLHEVTWTELEELLCPTVVAWPDRDGVVVSIERRYADELLGTSNQSSFSFVESQPAMFLARRAYVSSPRNVSVMQPNRPVLFYESERSGGCGAVIAIGRIVDSLVQSKASVSPDSRQRLVVADVDAFSSSDDVLVSSFDNILKLPRPFSRRELASINAWGSNNLQAATLITADNLRRVLDAAWSIA
ncbi:MAG: hypothetical protein WDM79_00640 [Terricaulis sp.]